MEGNKNKVADLLGNIGWWIYVRVSWRKNKAIQQKLNADVRDNLGYYLRESHPDFYCNPKKTKSNMDIQREIEKMKAKYPKDLNIEALEPALSSDIMRLLGVQREKERERIRKSLPLKMGKTSEATKDMITQYVDGFNACLDNVLQALDNFE